MAFLVLEPGEAQDQAQPGEASPIVYRSGVMQRLLDETDRVARSDLAVLIRGESGTGKEMVARRIHEQSGRSGKAFVVVNCAALPEGLVESELFGHVKGAFTGALSSRAGKFASADGGTIFLDEVGDMPLSTQAKLLRVLQEGSFEQVGGSRSLDTNVRVISATHRDLPKMIEAGSFRLDLYYRLTETVLRIPPLRERREDILPLLSHFAQRLAKNQDGSEPFEVSDEAAQTLMSYSWPGNVRELQNVAKQLQLRTVGRVATVEDLPEEMRSNHGRLRRKRKVDARQVASALRECGGNKSAAAEMLGISRSSLYRFLEEVGI